MNIEEGPSLRRQLMSAGGWGVIFLCGIATDTSVCAPVTNLPAMCVQAILGKLQGTLTLAQT